MFRAHTIFFDPRSRILDEKLGLVAGWPKQKAGGRPSRTLLAKSGTGRGSGGTGRGHPATEAIFCYEMSFKHDLPHDVG